MWLRAPIAGGGKKERGARLAAVLAGSWRGSPPPLHVSPATWTDLAPLLVRSNAAGLAWHRLRGSSQRNSHVTREVRRIGQLLALDNARQEAKIEQVVGRFRAAGIEPILIKGWSVARHYADPGLRPYGDIDLCVAPDQLAQAEPVVREAFGIRGLVDLHRGVPDLPDRSWDTIYEHSRLEPLGRSEVRVLGAEDELRLLCLHLVRHSGWRPLWLCDVAAALEDRPADFDWNYCLGGDRRLSAWVRCVLGLAHHLLDARLDGTRALGSVPPWFAPTILWHWGTAGESRSLTRQLGQPDEVWQALLYDWLNPVKALFRLRLNPNHWRPAFVTPPVAVVGRLVLLFARAKRLAEKTWDPAGQRPFELHRESVM